jgi:hypothetical protein
MSATLPSFAADSTKPTKAEADAFRLSMDKVNRTIQAYTGIFEALAQDPALVAKWKAERANLEDTNGRDTMSIVAARLASKQPKVNAAFTNAGITPKEAGMTMETVIGGMLGIAMLEGTGAKAELPKGFVKENVDFVKAHKNEIVATLSRMQELAKKYPQLAKLNAEESESEPENEK